MHRIDHATAAAVIPTAAAPGTPGYFTKGNPGGGVAATIVTDDWANAVQEEIAYVIEQSGLTLDKTSRTQLLQAIALRATASFKSRIINGDMRIDQERAGAAQTFTAAAAIAYCVDRFYGSCTGANVTGQRVAGSGSDEFVYQFTGAASVTQILFGQRIKATHVYDLASTTATFSVKLANSLLTTVTWKAYYANAVNDFTAKTQIATGTFTVDNTLTRYSTQIALPSNAQNGVAIELTVAAQVSGTWKITEFQLEGGAVMSAFDRRDETTELMRCQHHLQKSFKQATAAAQNVGVNTGEFSGITVAAGAVANRTYVTFPVPMFAAPTITLYNPQAANAQVRDVTFGGDCSASTPASSSERGFRFDSTGNAGSAAGDVVAVHYLARAEL